MMRVFPAGRLCSLRGVLMMWLLPAFVLVGAVSAAGAYWTYKSMVSTFMDDQMQLLADSQASQPVMPDWPVLSSEQVHEWGTYVGQVFDRNGQLAASSWPALALPRIAEPGFHDVTANGQPWRAYVAQSADGRQVQVVQSGKFRAHLAAGRALGVIAPVVVLLIVSSLILWVVVEMVSRAIGESTTPHCWRPRSRRISTGLKGRTRMRLE